MATVIYPFSPMVDGRSYRFMDQLKSLPVVDEIWVFGSRARGDHQSKSDIDIAIVCPDASETDWVTILSIIDEADTLLKIDCIKWDEGRISPELCENIRRDRKVIYVKKHH